MHQKIKTNNSLRYFLIALICLFFIASCSNDIELANKYLAAGQFEKALEIAAKMQKEWYRPFSKAQASKIAGDSYRSLGKTALALHEYAKCIAYNSSLAGQITSPIIRNANEAINQGNFPYAISLIKFLSDQNAAPPHLKKFYEQNMPPIWNVLLIGVDILRPDHLGCYGYPISTSPNIDRLASESIVFDWAFANSAWTSPSFLTAFTGLPAEAHGGYHYPVPMHIPEGIETLAAQLHKAGFLTAAFTEGGYAKPDFGLEMGFDIFPTNPGDDISNISNLLYPKRLKQNVKQTLDFFQEYKNSRWAMWFHTYECHQPLKPSKQLLKKIKDEWKNKALMRRLDSSHGRFPNFIQKYDASIFSLDEAVGKILATLKKLGLYDKTLIIFFSDHGIGLGNHNQQYHGRVLYVEAIHIPMIWRVPGQNPTRFKDPVSLSGLNESVLKTMGLQASNVKSTFSLPFYPFDIQRRGEDSFEKSILLRGLSISNEELSTKGAICWPFHLILGPNGQTEFFNLDNDPKELSNIADSEIDNLNKCESKLEAMLKEADHLSVELSTASKSRPVRMDETSYKKLKSLGYLF